MTFKRYSNFCENPCGLSFSLLKIYSTCNPYMVSKYLGSHYRPEKDYSRMLWNWHILRSRMLRMILWFPDHIRNNVCTSWICIVTSIYSILTKGYCSVQSCYLSFLHEAVLWSVIETPVNPQCSCVSVCWNQPCTVSRCCSGKVKQGNSGLSYILLRCALCCGNHFFHGLLPQHCTCTQYRTSCLPVSSSISQTLMWWYCPTPVVVNSLWSLSNRCYYSGIFFCTVSCVSLRSQSLKSYSLLC